MRRVITYLSICFSLNLFSIGSHASGINKPIDSLPANNGQSFIVAGYLANYSFANFHFEALPYLDRIYYFSVCPSETGDFVYTQNDSIFLSSLSSKLTRQQLYLVIGGWTQSQNIPLMAASQDKRTAYINSVVAFCKRMHIVGVDLDWEDYPSVVNDNLFVKLAQELSIALHKNNIAFTVALGVSAKKIQLAKQIENYVDEINVMSYGKFDAAGNQAPMNLFETWLNDYVKAGIKKEKLIVGVPFYGKRLPDAQDHSRPSLTYAEIVANTHPDFAINNYGKYAYNGASMIAAKTNYLSANGYKGIMSWELSQDLPPASDSSLLRIINTALHRDKNLTVKQTEQH
jgi:GH18 family chitinase